jgi:polyisoprenoid-binding protein YceI
MAFRLFTRTSLACAVGAGLIAVSTVAATAREGAPAPLTIDTARVSIAGTSNIHAYTATTTEVRVTRVQLADGVTGANLWDAVLQPGAIEAFEITIPAATLSSPREGLDKNMHKALNVKEHADITFRLLRLEPGAAPGAFRAMGALRIAGAEREIGIAITAQRGESTLTVKGDGQLLMTDFGIAPPKAMLGMLKTDPKVTVSFETVLAVPLT